MSMALTGQNLNNHQWKNRVILIITKDATSKIYTSQIEEFTTYIEEFQERKLITYKVLPNKFKLESNIDKSWKKGSDLYSKYNRSNSDFRVLLIGLDGSIKIDQKEILTAKSLLSTIDAMPMRRTELKNKP
jgi:hypothetical protein